MKKQGLLFTFSHSKFPNFFLKGHNSGPIPVPHFQFKVQHLPSAFLELVLFLFFEKLAKACQAGIPEYRAAHNPRGVLGDVAAVVGGAGAVVLAIVLAFMTVQE